MPETQLTFGDWGTDPDYWPPAPDEDTAIVFYKNGKLYAQEYGGEPAAFFAEGTIIYQRSGTLAVETGPTKLILPFPITFKQIFATVETAPAGAAVIVDVNLNGTTLFTTQTNRPRVSAGSTVGAEATPDITTGDTGDELTWDIDQIGSSTPGAELRVYMRYTRL